MVGVVGSSPIEPTNDKVVIRNARCVHLLEDERAFVFMHTS